MQYGFALFSRNGLRAVLLTSVLSLALAANADISYKVTAREGARLGVQITIPHPVKQLTLQMPNWGPGGYVLSVPGKNVEGFTATDSTGHSLTVEHPNDYTWIVPGGGGPVTVSYTTGFRFAAGAGN